MIPDKLFVPSKTDSEKIQSLDSCIESCLRMLEQDLQKRKELSPVNWDDYGNFLIHKIHTIQHDFVIFKHK
jgi:hypothetical protein